MLQTLTRLFSPPSLSAAQIRFFHENGYLILPGAFSRREMAAAKAHIDHVWENRAFQPNMVIDSYFGLPGAQRTHFRKVSLDARAHPYKLLDPHLEDPLLRDLATAPLLMGAIRALLGANPLVCNTLLFERGSQQAPHFDTFFMPSVTPNMMAASWVAIDPVSEASGPVYYYPKSHLIAPFRFSTGELRAVFAELETDAAAHIARIIEEHGLKREMFLPRSGDVLIWHAQLLHGGSAITDPSATRTSLVTHYWTEVDFPDPAQRIDLGRGRWLLKRDPQPVVDQESVAEAEALLAEFTITEAQRAEIPAQFDARSYLMLNRDLVLARVNPWEHYVRHGRREGRVW